MPRKLRRSPKCHACHENSPHLLKTSRKYCATHNEFRHVCRHMHVRMSRIATSVTQNHETLTQDRFCSFPHRHGDATGKPGTRDETCWSIKTGILCETSFNFHIICSYRIDVFLRVSCEPQKNCYLKIDVSCKASVNFQHISQHATPATGFAR